MSNKECRMLIAHPNPAFPIPRYFRSQPTTPKASAMKSARPAMMRNGDNSDALCGAGASYAGASMACGMEPGAGIAFVLGALSIDSGADSTAGCSSVCMARDWIIGVASGIAAPAAFAACAAASVGIAGSTFVAMAAFWRLGFLHRCRHRRGCRHRRRRQRVAQRVEGHCKHEHHGRRD